MRQIEEAMRAAVEARFNWCCGNTQVKVNDNKVEVYLHGNLIYKKQERMARFTLVGWNSDVTRNRLRALGVSVRCRNKTPQMEVNGEWGAKAMKKVADIVRSEEIW